MFDAWNNLNELHQGIILAVIVVGVICGWVLFDTLGVNKGEKK